MRLKNILSTKKLYLILSITILGLFSVPYLVQSQQKNPTETKQEKVKTESINPTDEKVTKLVARLQEVKNFQELVNRNGKSKVGIATIAVPTIGEPFFVVKVYEGFPDHDTVFNWYRVSVDGEVWRQDLSQVDKWDLIYPLPTVVETKPFVLVATPVPSATPLPTQNPNAGKEQALKELDDKIGKYNNAIAFWQNNISVQVQQMDQCGDNYACANLFMQTAQDMRYKIDALVLERNAYERQKIQIMAQ